MYNAILLKQLIKRREDTQLRQSPTSKYRTAVTYNKSTFRKNILPTMTNYLLCIEKNCEYLIIYLFCSRIYTTDT